MSEFEKKLVNSLNGEYKELIKQYEGASAIHAANLLIDFGKDERKTLEKVVRIIELSTLMLNVPSGKVAVSSDLSEEQVIKWTPHSETIQINIRYLSEKESREDARKLMIAVVAAVFAKHVRAVVESSNETVHEYAEKMGWFPGWRNPVDPSENPKLFLEQKYVKDALAYGIAYTDSALQRAEENLKKLEERKNG